MTGDVPLQMLPNQALAAECSAAQNLLAVLRQEQACLIVLDLEAFSLLLPDKADLINKLSVLASNRHRLLATAGFAASETGMQRWVAQTGNGQSDWQQLLVIVRDAQEVNRVNGLLLSLQLVRNQARLQALGVQLQNPALYGPDGQAAAMRNQPARARG